MKFKNVLSTGLVLTMIGGTLAGCGGSNDGSASNSPAATGSPSATDAGSGGTSGKTQELKVNFNAEPPVLDISKNDAEASSTFINMFSEGLYRLDKDGKPQPALAAELPQISDDKLTYTIKLRDGLVYSDGSPLKAGDFVYSFQRSLDPNTAALYAFMIAWIKGGNDIMKADPKDTAAIEAAKKNLGVKAPDDKTLVITLERPVAFFTQQLAFTNFFPQKEEFVKAAGDKYGTDADKVIGPGPWKISKWDHGQSLELVKNDKYWDAKNIKLDKITFNIVKDTATGLNLYDTGAADLTEVKGDQIAQYEGKPEKVVKNELTTGYLTFQQTKVPAFKNAKIRQALTLGLDRQGLVDTVLMNGSVPSTGDVPNGTMDGNEKEFRKVAGDTQPPFDPAKAKQLLSEGLQELGMSSLPQLKLTSDDTETAKKQLEFIVSQWKTNLNIDIVADPVPHALRVEKETKKDYQVLSSLWGADYNDPMTFLDMYVTKGPFNYGDYSNPEYDKLIKAAQVETDAAKRSQTLVDAEKILMQDMGVGPMFFRARVFVKKSNIDGFFFSPYGQLYELRWTSFK